MEWRPIPRFLGFYEISDEGKVRSVSLRANPAVYTTSTGKPRVNLYWPSGTAYGCTIEKLLALAFPDQAPHQAA